MCKNPAQAAPHAPPHIAPRDLCEEIDRVHPGTPKPFISPHKCLAGFTWSVKDSKRFKRFQASPPHISGRKFVLSLLFRARAVWTGPSTAKPRLSAGVSVQNVLSRKRAFRPKHQPRFKWPLPFLLQLWLARSCLRRWCKDTGLIVPIVSHTSVTLLSQTAS